ncbi:MAG: OB-fold domain-containing protein [Chloroflexi bacterium]|nr:OB-fold domain-containing protein [Chloroflexota bacterium]
MNDSLRPVLDGILDPGPPPRLLGGYCPECARRYFPKPMICPHCLEQVRDVELSSTGSLYSYTVVRTKAPFGLPQPYAVGYVDLEADGLRVVSLLDPERIDQLALDQLLTLHIAPLGLDGCGQTCLRYYFTPEDGEDLCDR